MAANVDIAPTILSITELAYTIQFEPIKLLYIENLIRNFPAVYVMR